MPFDASCIGPIRKEVTPPLNTGGIAEPTHTVPINLPTSNAIEDLTNRLGTSTLTGGRAGSGLRPSSRVEFKGLGSVAIDRIQLCEMGSSNEEGAYRNIAEMMLW